MRSLILAATALPLVLSGCGRPAGNNAANVANIVAEEGVEDVNSSIEGDQLETIPEAADDLAGNGLTANGAATAPTNTAVPSAPAR